MGKLENLKINSLAKSKLYSIKKQFSFTTYSLAIEAMCTFFEINKISPKEGVNQSYHNSIFDVEKAVKMGLVELKKQYSKDSQSMRKLIRAIEKDHLYNVSSKVSYLYDKKREEKVNSAVENSVNSIVDSSKNDLEKDREIENLQSIIEEKNREIKELRFATNSDENLVSKYEEKLRIIYRQYQVEKSFGKEKIIINMTKEAFDKLFEF